ncbi:MAG: hypothetical protein V4850_03825 [Myxococcota bacterium]
MLVYALSGLGKSTLATSHPADVRDADELLYAAVAMGFPDLDPRARLRAWRDLCRQRPWAEGGEGLHLWAAVRRAFVKPFVEAMREGRHRLVVTSLLEPPWVVSAYYGIEHGGYLTHLRAAGRDADNRQSEAMNYQLEGYAPLVRLSPGSFLGDREEIRRLLSDGRS